MWIFDCISSIAQNNGFTKRDVETMDWFEFKYYIEKDNKDAKRRANPNKIMM